MEKKFAFLSQSNINQVADFEVQARLTEPDVFTADFDKNIFMLNTLSFLQNPLFSSAKCLICCNIIHIYEKVSE